MAMKIKNPDTTIEDLNFDCLVSIFRHLPPVDLVNIEGVSKLWKKASQATWSVRVDQSLDFNNFHKLFSNTEYNSIERSDDFIRSILNRCGQFVKSVTCCNSRTNSLNFSVASLEAVAKTCKKIEWLSLNTIDDNFEGVLGQLLENSETLVGLNIDHAHPFTGECLKKIKSKRFETLQITYCSQFDVRSLRDSEALATQLKYLSLMIFEYDSTPNLHVIGTLKNLKCLRLISNHCINDADSLLCIIGRECRLLREVDLSLNSSINSAGIKALFDLPLLEMLQINNQPEELRDLRFENSRMPNLKFIELININMTHKYILKLVEMSPKLEKLSLHLQLSDNYSEADSKIEEALAKTIQERNDNTELELQIYKYERLFRHIKFKKNSYKRLPSKRLHLAQSLMQRYSQYYKDDCKGCPWW